MIILIYFVIYFGFCLLLCIIEINGSHTGAHIIVDAYVDKY